MVFCPRSMRASTEVQEEPSAEDAVATQRRCWVLPPSEPHPPEREPEADEESRTFAPAGRRPAGRRQSSERPTAAREEAPKRQSSVASDRSRRGVGGRSQNEGRGFSATINLGSSRQSHSETGAGGGPLSARRRNGTATLSATTIASKNGSSANGRAASSGTATATRQTRARSQEVTSRRGSTGAEPMVSISQLRRVEAQLESYRTRNAALEGEVAGLRAEAQAVKQGLDAEIERLRRELQSKDAQLHRELEVKKRQITSLVLPCEQNKALQTILSSCRAIPRESGSMQLPTAVVSFSHPAPAAPLSANSPANMATPRTTPPQVAAPQIYTASPGLQLRQLRGEPTAVSFASSANTVQPFGSLAFQRMTPRQVWTAAHTPNHPAHP